MAGEFDLTGAGRSDPTPTTDPQGHVADRIQRRSLHHQLVERTRAMIVEGEFAPGDRVPERALCGRFGVSRTPMREALKVLASEGLVELFPNRGARVTRLTIDKIEELFAVIGALEMLAGELACANIRDDAIAEIRALHYRMVLHHMRKELREYFNINQQIHAKIIAAAGNTFLSNIHESLASRIQPYRYMTNLSRSLWAKAVQEHEQILAAIANRDGPLLAMLLRAHLESKCEIVKASMFQDDSAGMQSDKAMA